MKVYYMNGAGNDFMVIDARGLTLDYPALARKCCSITGADGFMATDISDKADFRLHFYNSDKGACVEILLPDEEIRPAAEMNFSADSNKLADK